MEFDELKAMIDKLKGIYEKKHYFKSIFYQPDSIEALVLKTKNLSTESNKFEAREDLIRKVKDLFQIKMVAQGFNKDQEAKYIDWLNTHPHKDVAARSFGLILKEYYPESMVYAKLEGDYFSPSKSQKK